LNSDAGRALAGFVGRLIGSRSRFLTLRDDLYFTAGEVAPGISRLSWWDERGVELAQPDWDNGEGRILGLRRAAVTTEGHIELTALLLNADARSVAFKLPGPFAWRLILDSANPEAAPGPVLESYEVADRGAVLLAADVKP